MSDAPMRFVEPAVVTAQFHLRPGDHVADFGAGRGFFIEPLATAVGAEGVVYALEIQKNLVSTMGNQVREENRDNVQVLWTDLEEPNGSTLAADSLDVAIMVNTLFQFEVKDAALGEVLRVLRPGGKFFIIDWSESFGHLGPEPTAVVSAADAQAATETAGFTFERSFAAGEHHYGLAFRKS